jgi:hypothetical protein
MMSIAQKSRVSFMVYFSFTESAMTWSGMGVAGTLPEGHQKDQHENAERDQDEQYLYGVLAQNGCAGLVRLIGQDLTVPGDGDASATVLVRLTLDDDASACREEQGGQYKQTDGVKNPLNGS